MMKRTVGRALLFALMLAALCVSAFAFTAEEEQLIQEAEDRGYLDYLYIQDLDEATRLDAAKLMAAFSRMEVVDSDTTAFADLEGYSPQEKGVVNAVVESGIMVGTGDGTFAPDATVTQAQAALILYRAIGEPEGSIQGAMWSAQVVSAMKKLGIIEEIEPDASITKKLFLEWMLNTPVETEYSVEMKVEANSIRVRISVPATEDPNEEYDIFAWDPDQMNMGRVGTWIMPGEWNGLPTAPFSGTLRKMMLVRRSDDSVVAEWTLDKPIITDNSLAAPENVTIYRSEAPLDRELYVFRGVDTAGDYHYRLERPEGGGNAMFNMAGFQMAAGRFGSEVRLSAMDAWETDEAFYTNISPKVTVPVTDTDGKNGYELEWSIEKNQVAARLFAPAGEENEEYTIYGRIFDDPGAGSVGVGAKHLHISYLPYFPQDGTLDLVEIRRRSDDTTVAMWRLEKPIVAKVSLPAPEGVTVTRTGLNDEEEVLRFTGLDLANYYYDLRNTKGGSLTFIHDEEITVAAGRYGSEVRLGMGQVSEDDDAFYTEYSAWATLSMGTAEEDSATEYSVELSVMGDRWISARLIAPADTDPDEKYRLYFWDSTQPELGRIRRSQRPSDGHNGIITPHWNCTLDTVLLEDDLGNELGQWTLEKPIICEESLPAPQNVTIRRSIAANDKELFVFEGLDPDQKCYLMEHTDEDVPAMPFTGNSFEAKAGRYGSEVLLRAEKAWETDGAFHAIVSPKVRIAVTDTSGDSGNDDSSDYAVANLRLDGTRVRWDTPNSNGKRIGYVVYLYSTQEQDWVRFGSIHDANEDSMRLTTEQEPMGGRYTALRVVTEELGTPDDVILGEAEISVDMGFIIAPRQEPTAKLEWSAAINEDGMKGWELRFSDLRPDISGDIAFRTAEGFGPTLGFHSDEKGNAVLFNDSEDLEACLKEGYFMVVEYNCFAIGVNELYYDWVGDAKWTPCSANAVDMAAKNILYGDGLLQWERKGHIDDSDVEYLIYVDDAEWPNERTRALHAELELTGTHEIRIMTVLEGTPVCETVQTIVCANGEEDYNVEGVVVNGAGATVSGGGAAATVNDDDSFCFEVLEGTFDVTVKKKGCLTYTVKNVSPKGKDVDLGTITLLAGDVDGNDLINARDINGFRKEFGKSGDAIGNIAADMNGDGNVNARDINVLRKNFGKSAVKDCTVEYGA